MIGTVEKDKSGSLCRKIVGIGKVIKDDAPQPSLNLCKGVRDI